MFNSVTSPLLTMPAFTSNAPVSHCAELQWVIGEGGCILVAGHVSHITRISILIPNLLTSTSGGHGGGATLITE